MITRIYIDNYKCFSNFEIQPQAMQLWLGGNGSGKSSVFDVLETLRDFVCQGSTFEVLSGTQTRWDSRYDQTFELSIQSNGGLYDYKLIIENTLFYQAIKHESLKFNGDLLLEFDGGTVNLFPGKPSLNFTYPLGTSRSCLSSIPNRPDNHLINQFRTRLHRIHILHPDPLRMHERGEKELQFPDRYLHDIVSWLRHLSQESIESLSQVIDSLRKEVFVGLETFKLEKISDITRALKFDFRTNNHRYSLGFDELSTGQKNLLALYSILYGLVDKDTTLCIDEPDNYVALREIQPWLVQLSDRVQETGAQCLMISHHPECINYLAARQGLYFYRDENGPVRAKPFEPKNPDLITPAELIARGWE